MTKELNDQTLNDFVKKHDIVILDIFTEWCGPCKMQAAILAELAKEVDSKQVAIAKIDADQAPETVQRFKITAIPTLVLFKKGEPVQTYIGLRPKEKLLEEISAL